MSNSDNTTGLMSGGMESWKLIAALFQMMICIGSDGIILPNRTKVRTFRLATGFDNPCMQDATDIVLSAATSSVSAKVTYMTFFGLIVQYVQIQNYLLEFCRNCHSNFISVRTFLHL